MSQAYAGNRIVAYGRNKDGTFKSRREFETENDLRTYQGLATQRAQQLGEQATKLADQRNEIVALKQRLREATRPKRPSETRKRLLEIAAAYPGFTPDLAAAAKEIVSDDSMASTLEALMERFNDLSGGEAFLLAGIGINRKARDHFDAALDALWAKNVLVSDRDKPKDSYDLAKRDVVIGGGLHAAIFASVRHKLSGEKPVVIDNGDRVGGVFAVSKGPSFFLNSRNRPGSFGVPGSGDALNFIPEGPLQPFDLGGGEFQTNDVLAWAIRMALMKSADVYPSVDAFDPANGGGSSSNCYFYFGSDRNNFKYCRRVIMATGLGNPRSAVQVSSLPWEFDDRHLSFIDLMRRMDDPFPFRGMKRVAVIGAGDSGKTAIETLTGQGPYHATAFVDRPDVIDWYGVPADQRKPAQWAACNRGRYRRIGSLLGSVVTPLDTVTRLRGVYGGYQVQGRIYDYVIDCTGSALPVPVDSSDLQVRGSATARRRGSSIYYVGPAASLAPSANDTDVFRGIPENATSIFRLAPKTALLAESL